MQSFPLIVPADSTWRAFHGVLPVGGVEFTLHFKLGSDARHAVARAV